MSSGEPSPRELWRIAVRVAGETAAYMRDMSIEEHRGQVIGRGAGGDKTRRADKWAEDYLVELLRHTGLPLRIVSEEAGVIDLVEKPAVIAAVDPLDGSVNYVAGIPFASVSIAFAYIDKPYMSSVVAGCVADIFHRTTYSFHDDRAYVDGAPARPLETPINAVTVYSRSSGIFPILEEYVRHTGKKMRLRVLGSASLEIIYAGLGMTSLFVNIYNTLRNIDLAAATAFNARLGVKSYRINGEVLDMMLDDIHTTRSLVTGRHAEAFIEFAGRKKGCS